MRFLLTFAIWILFIGGMYLYTSQRDATATVARESAPVPAAQQSERKITVELTPTFSIEEDPFALKTDVQAQPIDIRLNGISLSIESAKISRGRTLIIRDVSITPADHNELFVKASPPVKEGNLDHGIRVRLLDGARTLADDTLWSSGGGLVAGNVSFKLNDGDTGHDH